MQDTKFDELYLWPRKHDREDVKWFSLAGGDLGLNCIFLLSNKLYGLNLSSLRANAKQSSWKFGMRGNGTVALQRETSAGLLRSRSQ